MCELFQVRTLPGPPGGRGYRGAGPAAETQPPLPGCTAGHITPQYPHCPHQGPHQGRGEGTARLTGVRGRTLGGYFRAQAVEKVRIGEYWHPPRTPLNKWVMSDCGRG